MKIIISIVLLLNILNAEIIFNYNKLIKEEEKDFFTNNKVISNEEKTKEYIRENYSVTPEKKTIEDIKAEYSQKTLELAFIYKGNKTYYELTSDINEDGTYTETIEETQENKFGLALNGKIDLSGIGKYYKNLYGDISLLGESMSIVIERRWIQRLDNSGFIAGLGFGILYQMADSVRAKGENPFVITSRVGYNFANDLNFHIVYTLPSDSNNIKLNIDKDTLGVDEYEIGSNLYFQLSMRF